MLPQPKDAMRGFLACVLIGSFMVGLAWLLGDEIPATNEQLVTFMLGQLSGMAGTAVVYYFGTSKSSADKNEIIERRAEEDWRREMMGEPTDPLITGRDLPRPNFDPREGE